MPSLVPAAQYVRMSTDRQIYSTISQQEANAAYALVHGFEIVRTYADDGCSGLQLKGRTALQKLLADALSGEGGFEAILVYDVSRWGRFQDTDESAHYEFICRQAGVPVHYCGELFNNDGSMAASIIKHLKRVMAGEFSRELSAKVFAGQCRLVTMGFKMGGSATYGLRRQLVDAAGNPRMLLARGQQKATHTDRVILVPGPPEEIAMVNRIYRMSAKEGMSDRKIASVLNAEGVPGVTGAEWSKDTVARLLTSEVYLGSAIFNKRSSKLNGRSERNPRSQWVTRENAFKPLINRKIFRQAQAMRKQRVLCKRISDEELIDHLRRLLEDKGRLSGPLIDATPGMPSPQTYVARFGGMDACYALVGYHTREASPSPCSPELIGRAAAFTEQVRRALHNAGGNVHKESAPGHLMVDGGIQLATTVVASRLRRGLQCWQLSINRAFHVDYVLAGFISADGRNMRGYYLLPASRFSATGLLSVIEKSPRLERYRLPEIGSLYSALNATRR